jgi:L-asparaginase II
MSLLPGSLAKTGAEGVQLLVAPGGHAVAIKIRDGSGRAAGPASLAALRSVDQDIPDELAGLAAPLVRGGGRPIGDHRVRT